MTEGRVVVLGRTGRNFAAGMSGGIAYVWDADGTFRARCNQDMVEIVPLEESEDVELVRSMLRCHVRCTHSGRAVTLLADWMEARAQFVCVVPRDYQRVRIAEALARAENREPVFAELVGAARG
jgi:glutamate synthase (ferredoxin)